MAPPTNEPKAVIPPIEPRSPLDSEIAATVAALTRRGNGFALDLARTIDGDGTPSCHFSVSRRISDFDTFESPPRWRSHNVGDVASLADYAKRYGTRDGSVVFYDDIRCRLILDELPATGERETIDLLWTYSAEWCAWEKLLTLRLNHRQLFEFLIERQRTLRDATVIEQFRRIRYDMNAKAESDVQLDQESMAIAFTAKKGDELVRLPREIDVLLPALDADVTRPDLWVSVCMHMEARMPTNHNETLVFRFFCPEFEMARRERVNREIDDLRARLDGWLIVRGVHGELDRSIGIGGHS